MSILLMENFSFGEGYALLTKPGDTTQSITPSFLTPLGGRIVRYMATGASNIYCYSRYRFEKTEMVRDGEVVDRPSVLITGLSSSGNRYATAMYLRLPQTTHNDSIVWVGARMMQKALDSYPSTAASGAGLIMTVTTKNTDGTLTASRKLLVINHAQQFEVDRAANAAQGSGLSIFPKNIPGKPFFLDLEYNRATGVIRVWIDNIFCAETTGWPTGDAAATSYVAFGLDVSASSGGKENGFYLTDLLIAEDDGEGWCDRFGPDMWVESYIPTTDTINQWSRPSDYSSNHDVVAKSSFTALDTTDEGNQDYLHATASEVIDAYKGTVFLKDNILGVSTQSVIMNAGSATHAVSPVFVSGEDVGEAAEVIVTPGTGQPYAMRTLNTVNPSTGEPFTKEEIESMSFGLKVKY